MIAPVDIDAICFMGFFASSVIVFPAAYVLSEAQEKIRRRRGHIVTCKVFANFESVENIECYPYLEKCHYTNLKLSYEYEGKHYEHFETATKYFCSEDEVDYFKDNIGSYKYQVTIDSDKPSKVLLVDIIEKESEVKFNANELRKN